MHDVHRNSLIHKSRQKNTKQSGQTHSHTALHSQSTSEGHEHGAEDNALHSHTHVDEHGHNHTHEEGAYDEHDHDLHMHPHRDNAFEDRAFTHMHEHGHFFYHSHHHKHDPEHTTITHKIFKDPVRDWFAAGVMGVLILSGYSRWLPGYLSDGMLICAAVIGVFPVLKNALFEAIAKKRLSVELLVGIVLLGGLLMGKFLQVAVITLLLLIGSFIRLNFSWKEY